MQEIRVIFSKTQNAKYISHLDINRAMGRAVSRAKLPVWYTEGFNPHPYMSFSLPLPLGVESECESMDIRLVESLDLNAVVEKLNSVLPTGLKAISALSEFDKPENIAFADYVFNFEFKNNLQAGKMIKDFLSREEIIAQKKVKKGRRKIMSDVNIKSLVDSFSVSADENSVVVNARLKAGINGNLSPVLLCTAILTGCSLDFESKSIKRLRLLKSDYSIYK